MIVDWVAGEHKTPEYLEKHQPFGKIPSLHDGDLHVFESRAMSQYIANQYGNGSTLYPSDPKKRAIVDTWISTDYSYWADAATIVGELIFKAMRGQAPDEAVVGMISQLNSISQSSAAKEPVLFSTLEVLNKRLSANKYLAGQDFTLADICYAPYVQKLLTIPKYKDIITEKYPHFVRWWNDVSSRPSWKKVMNMASAK